MAACAVLSHGRTGIACAGELREHRRAACPVARVHIEHRAIVDGEVSRLAPRLPLNA